MKHLLDRDGLSPTRRGGIDPGSLETRTNSLHLRRQCRLCVKSAFFTAVLIFLNSGQIEADELDRAELEIESWRLTEARQILSKLEDSTTKDPRARYLLGKLLFYEGEYGPALKEFRQAIEGARAEIGWKGFRDRAAQAERVFSKLARKQGSSGRFVYRYDNGPDALLIPYAEKTLERQLDQLNQLLGDSPDFPIEIDILPNVEALADASGLSVEQIERTGTVGVTKYSRVMIISPRRLAMGYPWLDTLAHELTHFSITRVSLNHAPIWLHEGIAKLFEMRWRGKPLGNLTPEEAYVLDRAARERRLISLRRFHPSIAHLPNQEDATLAYAQVLSFLRYLNEKMEGNWIRHLLKKLSEGKNMDQAISDLSNFNLQRLYVWWKQVVSGRRQTPVPAVSLMKRRFKRGKTHGESGLDSFLGVEVRRHLRVGDLLRLRGHLKAAATEYRRASHLSSSPSPEISDRLAACLLKLGKPKSVIEMLPKMAELYPVHSTIFVQLGEALAADNKNDEALEALERANAINPFHPTVHCLLEGIYQKLGRTDEAKLEKEHCHLLATQSVAKSEK